MRSDSTRLDRAVLQGFYDRMRAVAPAAYGAMERDRTADPARAFPDTACGRLAASLEADGLRALGMWAHHWCLRFYDDDTRAGRRLVREIAARSGLGWTTDEIRWLLGESYAAHPAADQRFTLPTAALRELPSAALRELPSVALEKLSTAAPRELPSVALGELSTAAPRELLSTAPRELPTGPRELPSSEHREPPRTVPRGLPAAEPTVLDGAGVGRRVD
ncbi:hypothetical protein GCM10012279_45350 [Micromonospora yangpuensis]|uniref:Uncharacterized protein n=1 Tax=Micromonospora yangpuensis TaxID=683228 RepID=A0A1C6V9B4_9ACTN|nr:hypothetical protein GCM10012279_45350 [Micromonospora yangpuensis]SCL62876.1 hypothetical protein GA0070617_5046 [Micromonospora yangpuensis]